MPLLISFLACYLFSNLKVQTVCEHFFICNSIWITSESVTHLKYIAKIALLDDQVSCKLNFLVAFEFRSILIYHHPDSVRQLFLITYNNSPVGFKYSEQTGSWYFFWLTFMFLVWHISFSDTLISLHVVLLIGIFKQSFWNLNAPFSNLSTSFG